MNFKTGGGTKSGPPEEFSIFDFRFLIWEGWAGAAFWRGRTGARLVVRMAQETVFMWEL
jgi:hypothetical protein